MRYTYQPALARVTASGFLRSHPRPDQPHRSPPQQVPSGDVAQLAEAFSGQTASRKPITVGEVSARSAGWVGTVLVVSDVPISDASAHLAEVARSAARGGEVVYLTENGERLAATVPAAVAARIEQDADDFKRKLAGVGMLAQVEPVVYAEPDECAREAASRSRATIVGVRGGHPLLSLLADPNNLQQGHTSLVLENKVIGDSFAVPAEGSGLYALRVLPV